MSEEIEYGGGSDGLSGAEVSALIAAAVIQPKVLATTMAAINGVTYVDVTGLSFALEAGQKYLISAGGNCVPNGTRGLNLRLGGTATFSMVNIEGESFSSDLLAADAAVFVTATTVSTSSVLTSADATGVYMSYSGSLTCQNAGTLILQAANGIAGAGNSQVTAGMFLKIEKAAA